MKKYFTLIELIVVIVVIGILAAIVIPNISNLQDESRTAAIESNGKNTQTAVDTYRLTYNGDFPTLNGEEPKLGHSKQLDFSKLDPKYLRKSPQLGLYWLDHNGAVIYSDTDMPNGFLKEGNQLSWEEPAIGQASTYKIYGTSIPVEGAAKKPLVTFIKEVDSTDYQLSGEEANYEGYLVSSISVKGFESPAIGAGVIYEGYVPESPSTGSNEDFENEDGEDAESGAGQEETIAKVTPTTVGAASDFATLQTGLDAGFTSALQNGKNIEVFYNVSLNLYKETFTIDGQQISREQIMNYSGNQNHSISNLDSDKNRYLFRTDGKVYLIKPDNTAVLKVDLHSQLTPYSLDKIAKTGIAVEGDRLYISYNKSSGSTNANIFMAVYSLTTNEVISNIKGVAHYVGGYDRIETVITESYLYTTSLVTHSTSNPQTYVIQWDKQTGKPLKYQTLPYENQNFHNPIIFKDTNDGIWVSYTRTYLNGTPVRLFKLKATPILNGISETVNFPQSTMTRPVGTFVHPDGSIDIIGFKNARVLTKSTFK